MASLPRTAAGRTRAGLLAVLVLAAVGLVGFRVFEHFDHAGVVAASQQACPAAPAPGRAAPAGLTMSPGQLVRSTATQGSTTVLFTDVPGVRQQVVATRDTLAGTLRSAGYRITRTDQEPGYEAEAQFTGPHAGTLRVRPLCTGTLEARYALTS